MRTCFIIIVYYSISFPIKLGLARPLLIRLLTHLLLIRLELNVHSRSLHVVVAVAVTLQDKLKLVKLIVYILCIYASCRVIFRRSNYFISIDSLFYFTTELLIFLKESGKRFKYHIFKD